MKDSNDKYTKARTHLIGTRYARSYLLLSLCAGGVLMEMFGYSPRLSHAVITTFIALILLVVSAFVPKDKMRILVAFNVGFIIFIIMTVLIWWTIIVNTNVDAAVRQDESAARFAEAYALLDEEGREVLAMRYPKMRYRLARGEVRAMFESTKVPVGMFKLFMQTSNQKYISPQRDWVTKEMPPHIWLEIYNWLVDNDKIVPDSAAGSYSHLWIGNNYQHMMAYWGAGRKLVNLNDGADAAEQVAERYDRHHNNGEAA